MYQLAFLYHYQRRIYQREDTIVNENNIEADYITVLKPRVRNTDISQRNLPILFIIVNEILKWNYFHWRQFSYSREHRPFRPRRYELNQKHIVSYTFLIKLMNKVLLSKVVSRDQYTVFSVRHIEPSRRHHHVGFCRYGYLDIFLSCNFHHTRWFVISLKEIT